MDAERLLISKVATSGGLTSLVADGIDSRHFNGRQEREIWDFMVSHMRSYGACPTVTTLTASFPEYTFDVVSEPIGYVVDQFTLGLKRREAIEATRAIAEAIDDPEQLPRIDELFGERARLLSALMPAPRLGKLSSMDQRIAEYEEAAKLGLNRGLGTGIPEIDDVTLGIQPHEYVTIKGWTGVGKSTLTQWILLNACLQGALAMYVSLEMGRDALFRKWDTMLCQRRAREKGIDGFTYDKLKKLQLSDSELSFWKEIAVEVKSLKGNVVATDDVRSYTVDRVYADATRHKPDLIAIDYITLMDMGNRSQATWERVMALTQSLKSIARSLGIPIIGIAQDNRRAAEEGSSLEVTAFANSINQDSDIVLGFGKRTEEMVQNKQTVVKMLKNRDGRNLDAQLYWDMNRMLFEPWSARHDATLFQRPATAP